MRLFVVALHTRVSLSTIRNTCRKYPIFLSDFNQIYNFTISMTVASIKLDENSPSGSHADVCGRTRDEANNGSLSRVARPCQNVLILIYYSFL